MKVEIITSKENLVKVRINGSDMVEAEKPKLILQNDVITKEGFSIKQSKALLRKWLLFLEGTTQLGSHEEPQYFEPGKYEKRAKKAMLKRNKSGQHRQWVFYKFIKAAKCDAYTFKGKKYIVLAQEMSAPRKRYILATFLIRNDGRLRRITRYPSELDKSYY